MRIAAVGALVAGAFATALPAAAQDSEEFDVWVADLETAAGRVTGVAAARNVTARPGYDNQPWFLPDNGGLLYTSRRDGQVEVFQYDLETGSATRVTSTPEHEFSPSLTASGHLLVVRWAADMSEGHLWLYAADGTPLHAAPGDVPRVGYYAEAGPDHYLVFVNDSVQTIALSDRRGGEVRKLGERFGGSPPKTIPGAPASASYMMVDEAGDRWIAEYDVTAGRTTPIVKPRGRGSHYAWTPAGEILMADGNRLFAFRRGDADWREVASFDEPGLARISRIAVSPDGRRVALVGQPAD